jgi:hypothetical protein
MNNFSPTQHATPLRCRSLMSVIALLLGASIANATAPSIGTCAAGVATGGSSINLSLTISSGQGLIVCHKTISSDTSVTDTLSNSFSPISNVNTASGGCLSCDFNSAPATGSDTITVNAPGAGTNNAAFACDVNNFGSVDVAGGNPYTSGSTAQSGTATPGSSSDLNFVTYYAENPTSPSFLSASTNYAGSGTPTDLSGSASNATLLIGAATEAATASQSTGLQRAFGTPSPPPNTTTGGRGGAPW